MTEPEALQQVDRTYVRVGRRKLSYFSGCDYFRLASHPSVLKAARDTLTRSGLNVAASRLTTGNHELYRTLERGLARYFQAPDALVLPGGYLAPLAVAQALAGHFSHALVDERAHPVLLDAAQMLECPVLKFKHRAAADFARTVARCGRGSRPIGLTDGMFAHDGSAAPLRAYLESLPHNGLLLVDDAHGAGVLGQRGRGTIEIEGVSRQRVVQCITLSKAFGAYGGAVLGSRALREQILARSRIFIGATPIPLPLAGAALAAIKILGTDQRMRRRLAANIEFVRQALRAAGLAIAETPGPILSLPISEARKVAPLKRQLLAAGIYPPFLKYPGGPAEGYFRFVISSEHSRGQLDALVKVLATR